MSNIDHKVLKDYGDGEIEIEITARFVIYKPKDSINDVRAAFEKTMKMYSI